MTMINHDKPVRHSRWKRIRNTILAMLFLGLVLFVYFRFYHPYGEGVKTGQLNYVVYKGIIFKTYEGKLIQSGFWTNRPGGIQSNEFNFSISDKKIADSLMHVGGQTVELRYKEYFGALPWRGYSNYIVDKIISITPANGSPINTIPPTGLE